MSDIDEVAVLPMGATVPPSGTGWPRQLWSLVRTERVLALGVVLSGIAIFLTAFGPLIAPDSTTAASSAVALPPSAAHPFGTDANGTDVLSRVLAAPRVDVSIALAVVVIALVGGGLIGLLVGYVRGPLGELAMRALELAQAFPLFVVAMICIVMLGGSIWDLIGVAALLNAPIYIRLVRSQVLSVREETFVEASRANGLSETRIALRHVLPNSMTAAFAQAPITVGYTILLTAGLSFIGVGIRPPTPEWGSMIASGTNSIVLGQWWMSVFPGAALALTAFGFAAVGEVLVSHLGERR
jgi:peptide/nickel transport system permease protein